VTTEKIDNKITFNTYALNGVGRSTVKLIKPHPSLLHILHNNKKKIAASFINDFKEKKIIIIIVKNNEA